MQRGDGRHVTRLTDLYVLLGQSTHAPPLDAALQPCRNFPLLQLLHSLQLVSHAPWLFLYLP